MSKYSKPELQMMKVALKKMFGVRDELLDAPDIVSWMENAPIAIVEHSNRLKGESSKERDRRNEMNEVYEGNIDNLLKHLRRSHKDLKSLLKWEIIFKVCNDEILAVQKSIEQAELQVVFAEKNEEPSVPQTTEELLSNQSSSSEETDTTKVVEEVVTSSANDESNEPSGNVQKTEEQPLFNKSLQINKEEKSMGDNVNALLKAAEGTKVDAAAVAESNVKGKDVDGQVKLEAAKIVSDDWTNRKEWVKTNFVTQIISTQKPAALRVKNTANAMGVPVAGETDAALAKKKIDEKLLKMVQAYTGDANMTVAQFEASNDDSVKYKAVVKKDGVDNVAKAKAMFELLKKMSQEPLKEYAAYIPDADKVSYPVKGYMLGDKPYSTDEFIVELVDKSSGAAYAKGQIDPATGKEIENAITFVPGLANRKAPAKKTGVGAQESTGKHRVPVIKTLNRKRFMNDPANITYLYQKEDSDGTARSAFKAKLPSGEAATVACVVYENGQPKTRSSSADASKTSYVTKIVSIPVSVETVKITREVEAQFKLPGDILVTNERWGLRNVAEKEKGNFANKENFSSTQMFKMFTEVISNSGGITLSPALQKSTAIKTLKATADKQIEAAANDGANDLN